MQKNLTDYIYKNDILNYESHLNGFSDSKFQSLDSKSKELDLESKIDDLLTGKIINFSENQAAWHPKYRRKFGSMLPTKENKFKHKMMNKDDVIKFMQTYQRITQNMFKYAPKYSSIILNLNSNHQIKSIKYKK